jgi:outer membrane protein assembly factor BamA
MVPLGVSFVQETTVFREFGPLSGNTMRLSYEIAPKIGNTLSRQTVDADLRYYKRLYGDSLVALRFKGFKSWGAAPGFTYFGGNSEMRGYEYLQFVGQNAAFANAELRYSLVKAMLTPIGIMGGIRGTFFFDIGGGWFDNSGYTFATNKTSEYTPMVAIATDPITGIQVPIYGPTVTVTGFRLVDGRASYGLGLETFVLGFPMHFDWSWRTLFNKDWEDVLFYAYGGSTAFRKARFQFWMGFDF